MAQGHKAILWAVSFLICFPQSQLFPTPYSSLWNKPQFQRQELPLPIPKFKPLQRGASCSFLQFFFFPTAKLPIPGQGLTQTFPSLQSQMSNATKYFQPQPRFHAPWENNYSIFPSSSCSNSSFQVGISYLSSSPPGKTTDMRQTQLFVLSFQKDQFDLF